MSRKIQTKNKDLSNLEVVDADYVWNTDRSGKFKLSKDFDYYGKVEKGTSAFVTMTNKKGKSTKFVEDTNNLTKKTKNEILRHFGMKNKKVAWLVKKK